MKLGKVQIRYLRRFAAGELVHYIAGLHPHAFWRNSPGLESCNVQRIFSLEERGLIESFNADWRGCRYRISSAGHAALKEVENG